MVTEPRERLEGRNGAVWQAYLTGSTQDAIAAKYGLSQPRVSRIIAAVRESIPPVVIEELRKAEADRVGLLYTETWKILAADHPLVSVQRGTVIRDDETGERLQDAGPKIAAINTALRVHERVAKAYGLDAPVKVQQEVRHVDSFDADIAALVADLARRGEGPAEGHPEVRAVADESPAGPTSAR